jgi:hypothetical protein
MTDKPAYKATSTGSIDYTHYCQRGRTIRSRHAWRRLRAFSTAIRRAFTAPRAPRPAQAAPAPVSSLPASMAIRIRSAAKGLSKVAASSDEPVSQVS